MIATELSIAVPVLIFRVYLDFGPGPYFFVKSRVLAKTLRFAIIIKSSFFCKKNKSKKNLGGSIELDERLLMHLTRAP